KMSRVLRASIASVVVVGLVWVVCSLGTAEPSSTVKSDGKAAQSELNDNSLLAARYHLRSRTSRFFKRSTGPQRSGAHKVRIRRGVRRHASVGGPQSLQLAARYHLRGRTARFFKRSVS
ncbi:MAG: hypothetical protein ACC645_23850, partial [Pirellulales bacterium]